MLEKENSAMESFVSVVDKAWSQLDMDIGTLLNSLEESSSSKNGDDLNSTNQDAQSLYSSFIDAGSLHTLSSLVDIGAVNINENLDSWSSEEDVEKEKNRLLAAVKDRSLFANTISIENLRTALSSKASFTSDVLKRCWSAIEKAHGRIMNKETMANLIDLKDKASKTSFYENLLLKSKAESVKLLFELRRAHEEKRKLQRSYDNFDPKKNKSKESAENVSGTEATCAGADTSNATSDSSLMKGGDSTTGVSSAPTPTTKGQSYPQTPAPSSSSADQSDLAKKISVLEQQLEKSNGEVSRLEKELTTCMSVSFMPEEAKEAYREGILRVVELLKQQIDSTVQ